MPTALCTQCFGQDYCTRLRTRMVSEDEISDPNIIRAIRKSARELKISSHRWRDVCVNAVRDYPGLIIDQRGAVIDLDLDVFETDGIREWFRAFCKERPHTIRPRVRRSVRKRVRTFATILRIIDPVGSSMWGAVVANDASTEPAHTANVRNAAPCAYSRRIADSAANDNAPATRGVR